MNLAVFRLAWRNLFGQRRRTALLVIVVGFAAAGTVFFTYPEAMVIPASF